MSAERFATVLALFFDLDDTLCAYWEASKHGLRVAFERLGPPGKTPDEMIEHWARSFRSFSPSLKASDWYPAYLKTGEPTRTEQMRLALLEVGVDDPRRAGELSRCYMEERDRALRLFPDVTMVLDRLQERFRLGLITNGPADVQRQEIATLGLDGRFDPVLIEGELGFGKPHASVFEQAARLVACAPTQLLFVGNSYRHDIRPAIDAGWATAWVRRDSDVSPSSKGPEDRPDGSPEPTATIGSLRELLPLLGV